MKRVNKLINKLEEYLAVTSLLIASLLVFVQVVLRYVFNINLFWSEEAARYIIVWFIFIGSSIAVREKAHATVDAVSVYLPILFKKIFSVLANLAGISFCIILIWSGTLTVLSVVKYGNVTPTTGVPMAIPYLAMPVGGSLMLFRFLQLLINDIWKFNTNTQIEDSVTRGATRK